MIIHRQAARAILLTPARNILLMRIRPPDGGAHFWITPGGGREGEETVRQCLERELREELGLEQFDVGPLVWRRQHTFNWGPKRFCQREEYYIVQVDRFEPTMSDDIEAMALDQFRWWPVEELPHASERLTPLSLADIVTRYLAHGAPTESLELEVLVD